MKLEGVAPGTHVITSSGDEAELLKVNADGVSAQVRYVKTSGLSSGTQGEEVTLSADDIMTFAGERFVGPT